MRAYRRRIGDRLSAAEAGAHSLAIVELDAARRDAFARPLGMKPNDPLPFDVATLRDGAYVRRDRHEPCRDHVSARSAGATALHSGPAYHDPRSARISARSPGFLKSATQVETRLLEFDLGASLGVGQARLGGKAHRSVRCAKQIVVAALDNLEEKSIAERTGVDVKEPPVGRLVVKHAQRLHAPEQVGA